MSSISLEYAKALFDLSTSSTRHEILKLFDASLTILNEGLSKILYNPTIKKEEKKELIEKIFDEQIYRDFLFVLIDNDRIDILSEIRCDFEDLLSRDDEITDCKVYSKELLNSEYLDALKEKLEKKINSKVRITNLIDESIMGGIRVTYDSKEIDLTINQKFDGLISKLKE